MSDIPPVDPGPDDAEQSEFRQQLLPQQIKPRRRRVGLFVAIAVVVILIGVAGLVTWFVSRDDGTDRSAYCDALRTATNDGDLAGALESADPAVVDDLARLAPEQVAGDWAQLVKLRDAIAGGDEPTTSDALLALAAVQHIVSDAKSECELTIDLPLL